jgi:hypothetical protein
MTSRRRARRSVRCLRWASIRLPGLSYQTSSTSLLSLRSTTARPPDRRRFQTPECPSSLPLPFSTQGPRQSSPHRRGPRRPLRAQPPGSGRGSPVDHAAVERTSIRCGIGEQRGHRVPAAFLLKIGEQRVAIEYGRFHGPSPFDAHQEVLAWRCPLPRARRQTVQSSGRREVAPLHSRRSRRSRLLSPGRSRAFDVAEQG